MWKRLVVQRVTWVKQQEKIKKSDLVIQLSAESEFSNLEEQKIIKVKRKAGQPSTKSKSNTLNKRRKIIQKPKKKSAKVKNANQMKPKSPRNSPAKPKLPLRLIQKEIRKNKTKSTANKRDDKHNHIDNLELESLPSIANASQI